MQSWVRGRRLSLDPWVRSSLLVTLLCPTTARYPNALQCVNVDIMSEEVCRRAYPGTITSGMVCAGVPQGGKDSCQVRPSISVTEESEDVVGRDFGGTDMQESPSFLALQSHVPLDLTLLCLSFLFCLINFLGLWKQHRVMCVHREIWGNFWKSKANSARGKDGV